ncbi:hypothetical protein GOV08_01325 [Candidatus Woesearchaeota archaeon]|nr:hypothetical protein [Candidatus Woesearchaeota archaeon]
MLKMYELRQECIVNALQKKGAMIGRELKRKVEIPYENRKNVMNLWGLCTLNQDIFMERASATRYMRIEKWSGYPRLSPSIPREFSDYSIVGLDETEVREKTRELKSHIDRINIAKKEDAQNIIKFIDNNTGHNLTDYFCFLLAGDVAYNMAHSELREGHDGRLYNGSDIDLIAIHSIDAGSDLVKKVGDLIFTQKMRYRQPPHKEEVDFKLKDIDVVKEQTGMTSTEDLIACKIMNESLFLYGNKKLYQKVIEILKEKGALDKLEELHEQAILNRNREEQEILNNLRV